MQEEFKRLENIFDNAPIGIFQTSHSGNFIDLNNELVRIFGYDSKEDIMNAQTTSQLFLLFHSSFLILQFYSRNLKNIHI